MGGARDSEVDIRSGHKFKKIYQTVYILPGSPQCSNEFIQRD